MSFDTKLVENFGKDKAKMDKNVKNHLIKWVFNNISPDLESDAICKMEKYITDNDILESEIVWSKIAVSVGLWN